MKNDRKQNIRNWIKSNICLSIFNLFNYYFNCSISFFGNDIFLIIENKIQN